MVIMDNQSLINVLIGAVSVFGGWILNNLTRSVTKLEDKISELPITYVTKEDYKSDIGEVKVLLNKIFDKLENKVDKD